VWVPPDETTVDWRFPELGAVPSGAASGGMIRSGMHRRSRARFLAPIALAVAIAGTYTVVHSGLTHQRAAAGHDHSGRRRHGRRIPRRYVVRPGDNLTSIANRTGVPVGEIQTLNPNIDPNSLQTGQRLRLRR
jgi:hypothetical protein